MDRKEELENILKNKSYMELESWIDPELWKEMAKDEKELLAFLFNKQGENLLKEEDRDAFENFKRASKLAPRNIQIHFEQALAFAKQGENSLCLRTAIKSLKKVVKLDPDFFDGWVLWAQVLLSFGMLSHDIEMLHEANIKFLKAENLSQNASSVKIGHLYRHWGICWYNIGKNSGEAVDFQNAIEKYTLAIKHGLDTPMLWNDYGNSLMEFGILIGKKEHCMEAIALYERATKEDPEYFAPWLNLASSLELMFSATGNPEKFTQSYNAFYQAAKLNADVPPVWVLWGRLLRRYGSAYRDLDKLEESIEKFEVADMLDPDNPGILAYWAEGYLQYGSQAEDLESLHKSEEKITRSLKLQRDNPHAWCLYGNYFVELGRYYSESKYYHRAIKKFKSGLSIDERSPELWYGMAVAHFALGNDPEDASLIQQAAQYCHQAIECGEGSNARFWNDYGLCYFRLAEMTNEKHYLESALDRFEQAVDLDAKQRSVDNLSAEYLHNLGCALDYMGDFESDQAYYEYAIQLFLKALKMDPSFHHIHYNLGLSLTHYAELTSDVNALHKAIEHFQIRIDHDYEDDNTLNEWGITLIQLAHVAQNSSKSQETHLYYEEAEQKFMQALSLGNTEVNYNLACLYSLSGNYKASFHHLEKAQKTGDLPKIDELLQDEWLEGVRQTTKFRQFLEHLKKG